MNFGHEEVNYSKASAELGGSSFFLVPAQARRSSHRELPVQILEGSSGLLSRDQEI